jgi:NDP-sugar pyrophosphorylase family protein
VALRRVADTARYGAATVCDGRIQDFRVRGTETPGLVNAGCYLLRRDIFRPYPLPAKFSWEDFLQEHIAEPPARGLRMRRSIRRHRHSGGPGGSSDTPSGLGK